MPAWDDYTLKNKPEDGDTLMIKDNSATNKANKRTKFSGLWDWIVDKLAAAVISNLTTSNKTVIGALNELNSNAVSFLVKGEIDTSTDIDTLTTSGPQKKIYGAACPNSPGFGCFILNFKYYSDRTIFMMALGFKNTGIAVRTNYGDKWGEWKIISTK